MRAALLLLASILPATAMSAESPPIADRYQLSGLAGERPKPDPRIFNEKTSLETVRTYLLDPAADDGLKAQAAEFWIAQLGSAYYGPRSSFWLAVDKTFAVLEETAALPVSPSRRHAVSILFSNIVAQTRGAPIDKLDKDYAPRWKRAKAFAARELKDPDPLLREHFERYAPLPKYPDWRAIKRKMRERTDTLAASSADVRELLDKAWAACDNVVSNELKANKDSRRRVRAQKLDAKTERRLLRYVDHILDHRAYTVWASQYPRGVEEAVGKPDAARHGFVAKPVSSGWPEI